MSSSTSESYPSWDLIPDDILTTIFQKLLTSDQARCRAVCSCWNRIVLRGNFASLVEAPWEILSNDSYSDPESYISEVHLRSLCERKVYCFKLPQSILQDSEGGWLCGSSRGWLVMVVGTQLNPAMFLWNPLSGATQKLPPPSTLPFFDDCMHYEAERIKIDNFSSVVDRVEVFSVLGSDSTQCTVVAALFRTCTGLKIAMCTPSEEKWTNFEIEEIKGGLSDIIFSRRRGRLVVAASTTWKKWRKLRNKTFEVCLTGCRIVVAPDVLYRMVDDEEVDYADYGHDDDDDDDNEEEEEEEVEATEAEYPLGLRVTPRTRNIGRLAESSIDGKVVLVMGNYYSPCVNETHTKRFTLTPGGEVNVRLLSPESIFFGPTGAVMVRAINGVTEPDSLYFTTDNAVGLGVGEDVEAPYIVREQGEYSLLCGDIDFTVQKNYKYFTLVKYPSRSRVGWFMPHLITL